MKELRNMFNFWEKDFKLIQDSLYLINANQAPVADKCCTLLSLVVADLQTEHTCLKH